MTIVFWLILAAMTVLAALFILWPLWRRREHVALSRQTTNVRIYRERVAEIEQAQEKNGIDPDTAQARIEALGRRLLTEAGEQSPEADSVPPPHRRPWLLTVACVGLIPLVAFGIYLLAGTPTWKLHGGTDSQRLHYMAKQLQQGTRAHPRDAQLWRLLASTREAQSKYRRAASAYARANALLDPPQAPLLVREAEAWIQAAGGQMTQRAQVVLQQALKANPDFGPALWFAGLSAANRGDTAGARRYWQRLLTLDLPPAFSKLVKKRLAALPDAP